MVTIYVEGGGEAAILKAKCRLAFNELCKNAGFNDRMPRFVAMGTRSQAYDAFANAHASSASGTTAMLLVDSETIPNGPDVWNHLSKQDKWKKPQKSKPDQAHLMVACMETWLIADSVAFAQYFGSGFKQHKLPTTDLEKRDKASIYADIASATSQAKPKGKYGKARDSFEVLRRIDPKKLRESCRWAEQFFAALEHYS